VDQPDSRDPTVHGHRVNTPQWLLIVIWALEAGILVSQVWSRHWVEALYWLGVMLINVALFARLK
jgi:hypothetical protein